MPLEILNLASFNFYDKLYLSQVNVSKMSKFVVILED